MRHPEEKQAINVQHHAKSQGDHKILMTPAVRSLIKENKLDPTQITGTGRDGRISKEDIINYMNTPHVQKAEGQVQKSTETKEKPIASAAVKSQ